MAQIVQSEITRNNEASQPTGLSDEARKIISGDAQRTIAGDQHADLDDDMIEVSYDPTKKRNLILKKKKRNGHSSAPKWTKNSKYYSSRSYSSSDTSLTRGYSDDDDDFTYDESANTLVSSLYGSSSLVSDATDGFSFKPCGISQKE